MVGLLRRGFLLAAILSSLVVVASPAEAARRRPPSARPVASLTPAATQRLWRRLVRRRSLSLRTTTDCRPLRAVFYTASDWMRLVTKLAANASPCADYFFTIPPLVADKTQPRADQAWRIRALGPRFHALAELNWTAWSNWVATTGSSWYQAGVEARRRIAAAGYDVTQGDGWSLNELSSAVRRGDGTARADARSFLHGLYDGDGSLPPARGAVLITGMGQGTGDLSVYQARLQNWYLDAPFWGDMSAYVSDWSQEVYGDLRNFAVPGADLGTRRDELTAYLDHELALANAAPASASAARAFLQGAYNPLANAAWQWDSGFGWTAASVDLMKQFVSAQTYALRQARAAGSLDRFGFAWAPKNLTGLPAADFTAQTGELLDRLAAAIHDSAETRDPADAGVGACGYPATLAWCGGDVAGASFNTAWSGLATWAQPTLTFAPAAQTLAAGTASAALSVQLQLAGVAAIAPAPVTVTLASSSPAGAFSTSAGGPWSSTATLTVPEGATSTGSFYYRDTTAGSATLTAIGAGAYAGTQAETVTAGPAATVTVSPASATLVAGDSVTLSASAADDYGNPLASPSAAWSVSPGTPGSLSTASGPSTVFTASSTTTGSGQVVATIGGASASISTTVARRPIAVSSVTYSTSYGRVQPTVTVVDAKGAPVAGASVAIGLNRDGVRVASATGTTGAAGTVTFTLSSAAGCYTTVVTSVSAPATVWDGVTPTNRFCK
jgi:hypothetical protein